MQLFNESELFLNQNIRFSPRDNDPETFSDEG